MDLAKGKIWRALFAQADERRRLQLTQGKPDSSKVKETMTRPSKVNQEFFGCDTLRDPAFDSSLQVEISLPPVCTAGEPFAHLYSGHQARPMPSNGAEGRSQPPSLTEDRNTEQGGQAAGPALGWADPADPGSQSLVIAVTPAPVSSASASGRRAAARQLKRLPFGTLSAKKRRRSASNAAPARDSPEQQEEAGALLVETAKHTVGSALMGQGDPPKQVIFNTARASVATG